MKAIRLFCGYDERESVGLAVFVMSVLRRASCPVSVTALGANNMPQGSNAFTFSRFLVPWLCDYKGRAIFVDGADMVMQADIAELDGLFDARFAAQCVRHSNYKTRHPIKYRNTSMQCPNVDYPRKNWASVMLLNCEHPAWGGITPQVIAEAEDVRMLQLDGLRATDEQSGTAEIGALPDEWNRLVDEGQAVAGAKILHWTAGIPAFPMYYDAPGADLWREEFRHAMGADL